MSGLTRRAFLQGAAGVGAAIGAGAAVGDLSVATAAPTVPTGDRPDLAGPVVARVRDLSGGVVTLYVGTREVTVRDRVLADRLARAAATAGTA